MWYICSESRNFCLDGLRENITEQKLCNGSSGRLSHNKIAIIIKVQISIDYKNALRKLY